MADERGSDHIHQQNETKRARLIQQMKARRELMRKMVSTVGLGADTGSVLDRMIYKRLSEAFSLMNEYLRDR